MKLNLEKNLISTDKDNKNKNTRNISNPKIDSGYIATVNNITPEQIEKKKNKIHKRFFQRLQGKIRRWFIQ